MNRPRPPAPPAREGTTHTGKALLVIIAVVVIGWLVLKHGPSTRAATSSTTHPRAGATSTTSSTVSSSTTSTTLVPVASIKLQVLNGTGSGNLATQWSEKLKANPGYNTLAPDNATSTVAQSVIYIITPGYLPEARQLAAAASLPASAINTTIPAPASAPIPAAERANANLVLVIGPDLAGSG